MRWELNSVQRVMLKTPERGSQASYMLALRAGASLGSLGRVLPVGLGVLLKTGRAV